MSDPNANPADPFQPTGTDVSPPAQVVETPPTTEGTHVLVDPQGAPLDSGNDVPVNPEGTTAEPPKSGTAEAPTPPSSVTTEPLSNDEKRDNPNEPQTVDNSGVANVGETTPIADSVAVTNQVGGQTVNQGEIGEGGDLREPGPSEQVQEELEKNVEASVAEQDNVQKLDSVDQKALDEASGGERNNSGVGVRDDGTGLVDADGNPTEKPIPTAVYVVKEEDIPEEVANAEVVSEVKTAAENPTILTTDDTFKGPVESQIRFDQTEPPTDGRTEPFLTSWVLYVGRRDGHGNGAFPLRIAGTRDQVMRLTDAIEATGDYFVPDFRRD